MRLRVTDKSGCAELFVSSPKVKLIEVEQVNVSRMPFASAINKALKTSSRVSAIDLRDTKSHRAFVNGLKELPDTGISLVGLMTPQNEAEADFEAAELMIRSNYVGLVSILGEIANRMEARGSGTIIGVSSVAGERGRSTNYIYGSAKAGFTAFLSGLRNRLQKRGVLVLTVKPGFVRTRMTEGLTLPSWLTAAPEELAHAIRRAHRRRKIVIYYRPVWRLIMFLIRCIPERLFARMKL